MTVSIPSKLTVIAAVLALGGAVLGPTAPVEAQTAQDIVRSLQAPQGLKTRGLSRSITPGGGAAQAKHRSLVESLRGRTTRAITVEERTEIANVVKENKLPSIDLEVYFEYDSAAITPAAMPKLISLGQALSDDKLKGATFLIAGHTDAAGSGEYNQGLSERRAEAVKEFLAKTFKLDPTTLIAVGYGKEQLKLPHAPLDGENRRVQVVNLAVN